MMIINNKKELEQFSMSQTHLSDNPRENFKENKLIAEKSK
jgi:hypothetical protein